MIVVGIDPGITGGIAAVGDDSTAAVIDIPTVDVKVNGKCRRRVDVEALALEMRRPPVCDAKLVIIERAQASTRMGVSSAFAYGEIFGLIRGVVAANKIPIRLAGASQWKRDLGLIKPGCREIGRDDEREKGSSLDLARKLFPRLADKLARAKDDGRADALLLAHWGHEQIESSNTERY